MIFINKEDPRASWDIINGQYVTHGRPYPHKDLRYTMTIICVSSGTYNELESNSKVSLINNYKSDGGDLGHPRDKYRVTLYDRVNKTLVMLNDN